MAHRARLEHLEGRSMLAGITVTPISGLTTTDAGKTAAFTVVLTSKPKANVRIGISSSNIHEGTVSTSSLTFSKGNWNKAQTVTITGVDFLAEAKPQAYTIITAAATSTDANYNGLNPSDVSVTNLHANHAPAGTNKTITTLEDTAYTFTAADFGFSDANDSPANTLTAVKISTLPMAGSLKDNGVAVTAGQFVSVSDINAGRLKFTPAVNAQGTGYASFNFQVQDNGGTANGGVNLDGSPNTITVNVTSVNDAPAGTNKTITTLEDTAYTFSAADFGFTDPNDNPANTLAAVKISTLPAVGTLNDNGVEVTAGQFVSTADIAAGLLKFVPASNAHGAGYTGFTFQVQDNGGTANGGVNLDQSPNTITVNVTSVNDAPAGADKTISTLKNTAYTFTAADFGFSDANDSPANTLAAVKITTLPTAGTLTDKGVAVTAGQYVSAADISAGLLKFIPAANAQGAGYASFTFQVQDNGGTANGGVDLDQSPNTITVNVIPPNSAPAGADKTITTLEDTAYAFTAADFGFSDPNDSPSNSLAAVKITTLPTAGTLKDNGVAVTVGQFISVSDIDAGRLEFTPAANAQGAGYASFTFQVQDDGGTVNGGVNLDQSPNTITFNVTSVNDAPAGANKTITTLEDTAYTFSAADFGFSDSIDSPSNNLTAVKITTLPTAGTLEDNGVAVNAGQFVSAADIAAGLLKFVPAPNAQGAGYTSFTFQVQDDGGTANGGIDLDPSPNTITVNVTSVNDAPAGTDKTISGLENIGFSFNAADFGFTDPNDTPANSLAAVEITTLPTAGTMADNGVAVTAGQFISVADIAAGLLRFTPAANAEGAGYANFTFQVQDNGGTANGGVDLDQSPNTITLDVRPFNAAQILVVGADAGSSSKPLVKAIDAVSGQTICSFTAYESTYKGGVRVALGDVTGDGIPEIITVPGSKHTPLVKVFDLRTGVELTKYEFMAYSRTYVAGASVAVGDVNGDGWNDIVVAPSHGVARVKVFENQTAISGGFAVSRSFNAFRDFSTYRGGANVAVGDLDGTTDGNSRADIVVASGAGLRGLVRVFDVSVNQTSYKPTRQIYDPSRTFRNGLSVTLGDVNDDGLLDIITGAGPRGSSMVTVYDGNAATGSTPLSRFRAFPTSNDSSGIRVVAKDVDGTGKMQIFAACASPATSNYEVRRFRPLLGQLVDSILAGDPSFSGGGLNLG
jgi:hypothetical protein